MPSAFRSDKLILDRTDLKQLVLKKRLNEHSTPIIIFKNSAKKKYERTKRYLSRLLRGEGR